MVLHKAISKFWVLCSLLQFLESITEYETQIHISRHCISAADRYRDSSNRGFLIMAISLDAEC